MFIIYVHYKCYVCTVHEHNYVLLFVKGFIVVHPAGQDVELLCTVTPSVSESVAWIIDHGVLYTVQQLRNGILTGYSSTGNNLIIMNDDRNDIKYSCVTVPSTVSQPTLVDIIDESNPTILYVAGEYQYEDQTSYNTQ